MWLHEHHRDILYIIFGCYWFFFLATYVRDTIVQVYIVICMYQKWIYWISLSTVLLLIQLFRFRCDLNYKFVQYLSACYVGRILRDRNIIIELKQITQCNRNKNPLLDLSAEILRLKPRYRDNIPNVSKSNTRSLPLACPRNSRFVARIIQYFNNREQYSDNIVMQGTYLSVCRRF